MKKERLGHDPPAFADADANRQPLALNEAQVELYAAKLFRMSAKGPPWLIAFLVAFVSLVFVFSRLIH